MKFINDIKQKFQDYNSVENRYKRLKNNSLNQKARKEYEKLLKNNYNNVELSKEQKAILFSQAYKLFGLKNPSAAKFPDFNDYEITEIDGVYKLSGYTDCTNSYGAQVREPYTLEVLEKNDEWCCITNTSLKALVWVIVILLLVFAPLIIGKIAINNLY